MVSLDGGLTGEHMRKTHFKELFDVFSPRDLLRSPFQFVPSVPVAEMRKCDRSKGGESYRIVSVKQVSSVAFSENIVRSHHLALPVKSNIPGLGTSTSPTVARSERN